MTLNKQAIRSTQKIYLNGNPTPSDKSEIITLSEHWTEKEEETFRKLLKQGGSVTLQGNHFKIVREEKQVGLREW
jgi:hypothetical protein